MTRDPGSGVDALPSLTAVARPVGAVDEAADPLHTILERFLCSEAGP